MDLNLTNRVAIVTGATKGCGWWSPPGPGNSWRNW